MTPTPDSYDDNLMGVSERRKAARARREARKAEHYLKNAMRFHTEDDIKVALFRTGKVRWACVTCYGPQPELWSSPLDPAEAEEAMADHRTTRRHLGLHQ